MLDVAVSMITFNEEEFIANAIASCDFARYICLVDGGSDDETINVARANVPDGVELIVKESEWGNHFGQQRQVAYDLVPDDIDWWMRIDADEAYSGVFRDGILNMLSSLPEDIMAVRIRQTNLIIDEEHYVANLGGFETHPRIFRHARGENLYHQWTGEVHEFVQVMSLNGLNLIPNDIIATWSSQVFHFGWLDDTRRKERERLYMTMPGSGVTKVGDLTDRKYFVRNMPVGIDE